MIKTFPLVMDETFHARLAEAASKDGKAIKNFILEAVEKAIQEVEKKDTEE